MRRLAVLALLLWQATASADPVMAPLPLAYTQLPDPTQEAQAQALMQTIRCIVCQGQSIADSNADMAGDMRALVRQRIAAGEKPEAVRGWLISRYGQWVSYKPELTAMTWPLWAAPVLLLAIGGVVASRTLKRRRR